MAHNLNYNQQTGKHSFFSVQKKAWHGLGQIIEDYPTSAEAIIHAGLNYTVEKRSLFTVDQDNHRILNDPNADDYFDEVQAGILVPDYFANVRTDTDEILGVVGKDYNIIQNIDAFSFFDNIVGGKNGILYETAGALGKGERIFITAKLPGYIRIGRNDCIEKYLFLTTSHDGYGSITAAFTPVRIVCQNTLNAALKNHTNSFKIRHTANAKDRLQQAHQLLGVSNRLADDLEEVFNRWSKIRISDVAVKRLVQIAMAPNKETLESLRNGNEDLLSGAYNAVTGYFQNVKAYKDDETKFKNIMYGSGMQRSQTAFNLCSEFAKVGINALN